MKLLNRPRLPHLLLASVILGVGSLEVEAKICRSAVAVNHFKAATGFAKGRPGWIVDHVCPLACGGNDDPANMQWQTKAEAHKKDLWERTEQGCKKLCNAENSGSLIKRGCD